MRKSLLSLSAAVFVLFSLSAAAIAQNPYDKYYTADLPCAVEHVQPSRWFFQTIR